MLKPLALGLLTMTAACTGAAIAGTQPNPDFNNQSWETPTLTQQQLQQLFGNDWQQILNNPQFQSLCSKFPQQCAQWEQFLNSWSGGGSSGQGSNPQPAPEVDPAGAMGALTILGAMLVMLRGRRPAAKPV